MSKGTAADFERLSPQYPHFGDFDGLSPQFPEPSGPKARDGGTLGLSASEHGDLRSDMSRNVPVLV
jgi:hypothetical protein